MTNTARKGASGASCAIRSAEEGQQASDVLRDETGALAGRTARRTLDAAMSERELQEQVIALAKTLGWHVHHQLVPFRRGKDGQVRAIVEPHTDKGFPDLVLAHPALGVEVHMELKTEAGKLSAAQREWGDVLTACGAYWFVFKPSDWEQIVAILEGAKP